MKGLLKYLITLVVGAGMVVMIADSKDIWNSASLENTYHILCDAFFAVGAITTCLGLLFFVTNNGVFDGIVYSVKSFFSMFKRDMKREYATFYDYKESLAERHLPVGFLVICGLVFLVGAFVTYWLYTQQL